MFSQKSPFSLETRVGFVVTPSSTPSSTAVAISFKFAVSRKIFMGGLLAITREDSVCLKKSSRSETESLADLPERSRPLPSRRPNGGRGLARAPTGRRGGGRARRGARRGSPRRGG